MASAVAVTVAARALFQQRGRGRAEAGGAAEGICILWAALGPGSVRR